MTAARAKLEERATQVRELVETLDLLYARFLTARLSADLARELKRVRIDAMALGDERTLPTLTLPGRTTTAGSETTADGDRATAGR